MGCEHATTCRTVQSEKQETLHVFISLKQKQQSLTFLFIWWLRIPNFDNVCVTLSVVYSWNKLKSHLQEAWLRSQTNIFNTATVAEHTETYLFPLRKYVCALSGAHEYCHFILTNTQHKWAFNEQWILKQLKTNALLRNMFAEKAPLWIHLYISLLAFMWLQC